MEALPVAIAHQDERERDRRSPQDDAPSYSRHVLFLVNTVMCSPVGQISQLGASVLYRLASGSTGTTRLSIHAPVCAELPVGEAPSAVPD